MREKEVMLSQKEHRKLNNLKKSQYPEHTPYGWIIGDLIDERLNDE